MQRNITLHVFASAKGGVGKSTLAVVCAKLIAAGRTGVPVVIDADLTGTSLADGLRLEAPKTATRPDGTVDIDAPPTGQFFLRDEVVRLRRTRRDTPAKRGLPPPYLNDALRPYLESKVQKFADVQVDGLLWRHEEHDEVRYLPSSPLHEDIVESLEWFSLDAYDWMGAMTVLLHRLSFQWPEMSDVVVDVPPGLFGFGAEMLELASSLQRNELPEGYPDWTTGPIVLTPRVYLVTTPDENDLLPVYESVAQIPRTFGNVHILVNKSTAALRPPQEIVGPMLGLQLDETRIHRIPLLPATLGRIFVDGKLRMDDDVRALARILVPQEVV